MILKLSKIREIESCLRELVEQKLPIRIAYRLSIFIDEINVHLKKIEEMRVILVKKYGANTEDGSIVVPPENFEDFKNDFLELLEEEVEIKFEKIKISDAENALISVIDFSKISLIFTEV